MIEVAIVGGGPAGSHCASRLAEKNIPSIIFDHTHPREKPCGGLISALAQESFPFLKQLPVEHSERNRICFISPSGKRVYSRLKKSKILGCSRLRLDQHLLNLALEKGAKLIKEKVMVVEKVKNLWKIKTAKRSYLAKILVGADGVDSIVRKSIIGPLNAIDRGVCFGYLVKGLENEDVTLRFLPHRRGYIWVIPRGDHTSVGIGSSEISLSSGLKKELDTFIEQYYPHAEKISKWAASIPNVKEVKTFQVELAGANWILIGDAAGHVHPITGEGIPFALLDGELAAQAIAEKNPQRYDKMWREMFQWGLLSNIKLRKWMYKKTFLEAYCKYLQLPIIKKVGR